MKRALALEHFELEALPPDLRDLTLFCHPIEGPSRSGAYPPLPAYGLAPQSALGFHPWRALSSAAVRSRIRQTSNRTIHLLIKPDILTCYRQTQFGQFHQRLEM